jgi:hypothetical protein
MAAADNKRKTGFNAPAVVLGGLAAIIFVYALSLFIEGSYNAARNREEQAKIYTSGPSESVTTQLAAQQALLQEKVRYLDADKGVLCMPIEDAMERVVVQNARQAR